MPREDSRRSDHSKESSRLRLPSPPTRYSERSDCRSTRDGKISYREKGDGEGRRSRDDRHEGTKSDRRERESSLREDRRERESNQRESSQRDTRHDRLRPRSRSRSKSPPSGKGQPPSKVSNLDQYKTSGLLDAMNPVRESSSKDEKAGERLRLKDEEAGERLRLKDEKAGERLRLKDEKAGERLDEKAEERLKPNFGLSGKLAEDTNKFNGVVVKYNEPAEAKKPSRKWRLYPFKGEESLDHVEINRQSAFLLGRDRRVADIPIDHPSCSSQHAVIQFRAVTVERGDGTRGKKVRPYLIDLESSNGTFLNNKQIEPRKYYEMFEKDCIKFGFSSREYVLMHAEYQEDDK